MDVETLDMSIIDGVSWAQDLKNHLNHCTDKYLVQWSKVVLDLGVGDQTLNEWVQIFKDQIEERYEDMLKDVTDMKAKVLEEIEDLLKNIQKYSDELGLDINHINRINPNEGYYQVKKELSDKTDRLKETLDQRKSDIENLIAKQKELCNILEKMPYELSVCPIPKKEEIEMVQNYVDSLEQEKFNREERYITLKDAIAKLSQELEFVPTTDFERDILSETQKNFDITEANMKRLQKCHENMVQQLENRKEEIDTLRNRIDDLWNILEESMSKRHFFHEQYAGYTSGTLQALREEVKRLEELKKANIKVFVEKLRTQLHELWDSCYHKNEEDQANYQWLTSDLYTEDLLSYHELEVRKWKNFHKRNEKLIQMFKEHQELWNKLLEMENQHAVGPNRYKNRGGQLLREEKERNKLSKKIPLLEEKIQQESLKFYDITGTCFLIFGTPILEYIEGLHTERDENRKIKMSARKQVREQETLTPARSCLSLYPSSSRVCLTPLTTSVKRKIVKPITTGKKAKLEVGTNSKIGFSSIQANRTTNARRMSQEKAQRMKKCRRLFAQMSNEKENLNDTNSTNYDAFEKNISSRVENCRSTLIPGDNVPALHVIPCTPTQERKRPTRTPSNLKSMPTTPKQQNGGQAGSKLTRTPSNLKLLF